MSSPFQQTDNVRVSLRSGSVNRLLTLLEVNVVCIIICMRFMQPCSNVARTLRIIWKIMIQYIDSYNTCIMYMHIHCVHELSCITIITMHDCTFQARLTSAPFLTSIFATSLCPFELAMKRAVSPVCVRGIITCRDECTYSNGHATTCIVKYVTNT